MNTLNFWGRLLKTVWLLLTNPEFRQLVIDAFGAAQQASKAAHQEASARVRQYLDKMPNETP